MDVYKYQNYSRLLTLNPFSQKYISGIMHSIPNFPENCVIVPFLVHEMSNLQRDHTDFIIYQIQKRRIRFRVFQ